MNLKDKSEYELGLWSLLVTSPFWNYIASLIKDLGKEYLHMKLTDAQVMFGFLAMYLLIVVGLRAIKNAQSWWTKRCEKKEEIKQQKFDKRMDKYFASRKIEIKG
jgi:hypothetical protein